MTLQLRHVASHDSFIFSLHANMNRIEFEDSFYKTHGNIKDFLSEDN